MKTICYLFLIGKNKKGLRTVQNLKRLSNMALAGIPMNRFEALREKFGNEGLRRIVNFNIRNARKMLKDDHWLPLTKDQKRWYKELGDKNKVRPTLMRRDYRQLSDQERHIRYLNLQHYKVMWFFLEYVYVISRLSSIRPKLRSSK